jgi:hypothetical protein
LQFIEHLRILPQCNEQTGWYTAQGLDTLRKFILETISNRVDQFIYKHAVVRFEQSPLLITPSNSVVQQRLLDLERYLSNNSTDDEDWQPNFDVSLLWLKKYMQSAPHSQLATEEEQGRSLTLPTSKSALFNRSSSLVPAVDSTPIVQVSSATKGGNNLSAHSQSKDLIDTINRIQEVYNVSGFDILGDSDSEED